MLNRESGRNYHRKHKIEIIKELISVFMLKSDEDVSAACTLGREMEKLSKKYDTILGTTENWEVDGVDARRLFNEEVTEFAGVHLSFLDVHEHFLKLVTKINRQYGRGSFIRAQAMVVGGSRYHRA